MLVDINLLPQKERKKSSLLIPLILVLLLVAASSGYLWLTYKQKAAEERRLDSQLSSTQTLRETIQERNVGNNDLTAAEQLEAALTWAEKYPVSTHTVLRHLASLLPERGFILSFSYQDIGTAQLSIQFDSSREAAFFLKSLQDSKFVKESTLSSIVTESVQEDSERDVATNQILPRYIAQYTLMIDKSAVRKAENDGEDVS